MDFEEQQLRDALDDPSWELPTWPEGAERIRRAARRRRQRHLTALFSVVALVAMVGGVTAWQLRSPTGGTRLHTGPSSIGLGRRGQTQTPPTVRGSNKTNPTTTTPPTSPPTSAQQTGPGPSTVSKDFEPASVTFVSPTSGWVLGTLRNCTSVCTAMAKTTDGGRSWTSVPAPNDVLPATSNAPGGGVGHVRFANPQDGWVFGPDLWATHDGGSSWSWTTLPGNESVIDLEATPQFVWVLAATYNPSTGYGSPQLFESPAHTNDFQVVSGATFASGTQATLAVSGNTAWLAAPGQLLATAPGGSLVPRTDPCPSAGTPQLGAFSNNDLVVACSSNGAAGSSTKQVYLSANGGMSYADLPAAPTSGALDGVTTNGSTVVVAAASGASVLYADDGHGWQTVYAAPGGANLEELGFTTTTQGVVIVGEPGQGVTTHMLMSTNGGLHWSLVNF